MASKVKLLLNAKKISHPTYVKETQYEVMAGSHSYGTNTEESDFDVVGFCIPPKHIVFPSTDGVIPGFGDQGVKFEEFSTQHQMLNNEEYDIKVYNIVKYFDLCMDCNPNMVDTLFVHPNCILHKTKVGDMVRDARKQFIHKGCWHRFKGYAFSQLKKVQTKKPEGARVAIVEKYGFDVKFASHIVRLLDECEQLLMYGEMDLFRSKEYQKAIRRGEVPFAEIEKWYYDKLPYLESLSITSSIPYSPNENRIKALLLDCLEESYGNMANVSKFGINIETELQNIANAVNAIRQKVEVK